MLCVKCISVILTAQQAAKVHPSNKADFSYPSVSLGVQGKELMLSSCPPGSSVCVYVICYSVSCFVCLFVHLPVPVDVRACRGERVEEDTFLCFWRGAKKNGFKSGRAFKL